MKTKDRVKEEIGFYKLAMTIFSAIDFPMITWIWKNNFALDIKSAPVFIIATLITVILIIFCGITLSKIKELDNYV